MLRKSPLVLSFMCSSYSNKIIKRILELGDGTEEIINDFHISLKHCDLWMLYETK